MVSNERKIHNMRMDRSWGYACSSPLLARGGGCAIKKKKRSYFIGADGVVAQDPEKES